MKLTFNNILKILSVRTKKTLWILGLHAFFLILFFVLIDFIVGGFVFYQNVFLAEKEEPNATESIIKFNVKDYQDVLGELQAREQNNKVPPIVNQPNTP